MKTFSHAAFLAAASALSLRADIFDSPMVRVTPELDLFATATARVEYDDNLFLGNNAALPESGTFYDLVPGLEFQYGKDLPLSASLSVRRHYRTFFDSRLRDLDDEQDDGAFNAAYDGGGPLKIEAVASYRETARNTEEELAAGAVPVGTLVRVASYYQSLKALYQFTEKTSGVVGVRNQSNRYDPRYVFKTVGGVPGTYANTEGLTESDGWTLNLGLTYKFSEKLSLGPAVEHGLTDVYPARGSTTSNPPDTLVRDYLGLTAIYVASDKLTYTLSLGYLDSSFKSSGGLSRQSPSYSLRITHMLSEKMDQSLTVGQDANASPNGGVSDSFQVAYDINYNNSEAFRTFLRLNYGLSTIDRQSSPFGPVSTNDVEVAGASLGGSYVPDAHWSYTFLLTHSTSLSGSYDVNRVSVEASFRW